MDSLKAALYAVLDTYAIEGLNGYSTLTVNRDETLFVIISVANLPYQQITDTSVIVRIEADFLIIDKDINNRPLLDALLQAGIPREQIILAYAGEPIPQHG